MKKVIIATLLLTSNLAAAHGLHPVLANYLKTTEASYEYVLHNVVGYAENDFRSLLGVATEQDAVRKIRVIKYKFATNMCVKDLEVYAKLDGSGFLSHKVVGCAP